MVDDVKNARHTRSARSWGSYPTVLRAVAVPRWRGKRYGHTPRSIPVIDSHQRAFSSSWSGGGAGGCAKGCAKSGAKDCAKSGANGCAKNDAEGAKGCVNGGAESGAKSGVNGGVNGCANGDANGCPMPGDGASTERWRVQSSSSSFAPPRQGHVERLPSMEKWGCQLEGRNGVRRACPERDPGADTGTTVRGTRGRVKTGAPKRGS